MTTVGYGDGYPLTQIGRVITFFLCIAGTMIVSLMAVMLNSNTSLNIVETRVFNELERLKVQNNMKTKASAFIYFILKTNKISKEVREQENPDLKLIKKRFKAFRNSKVAQLEFTRIVIQFRSFGESAEGELMNFLD